MKKPNREEILNVLKSMEKKYGIGSVYSIDSKKAIVNVERWSTGISQLDAIIGGGMPYGRIIELFGTESAGKTSLGYHLMAQHSIALDIPIEGTFDSKRAKIFGNKKGQLVIRRADTGEQCLEMSREFIRAKCPIIIIDSVPAMVTEKEFDEEDMNKQQQPGRIAALLSSKLPKLNNLVEKNGTTLIFINQLRDQMNAILFGPQTHTPGGRALKHYSSIRMQVARREWIKIANKYEPWNSAACKNVGLIMKVKIIKSKVCEPLGECEIPMFFDRGFVERSEINNIRREIQKKLKEKYEERMRNNEV